MQLSLREFWFPILLFLSSIAAGLFAVYVGKTRRRVMIGASVILFAVAVLAYSWGDPVRGPFTYLVHPRADDKFMFHAGFTTRFPFKRLSEGIDFSRVIRFNQPESGKQPLELWV